MMMEVSLALLAFSAPVTASIIVFRPQKNGNGKYVTTREYDSFKTDLSERLGRIEDGVADLSGYVKSRLD